MFRDELHAYVRSFKVGSTFFYTLLVDMLTWGLIAMLAMQASELLTRKGVALTGGRAPEEFKVYFASLSPEQLAVFASGIKWFVTQLVATAVLVPLAVLLVLSLSQLVVWHLIGEKELKMQKFWKWAVFSIVFFAFLLVAVLVQFVLRLPFMLIGNQLVVGVINGVLLLAALTAFLIVYFISSYRFVHTLTVWHSVGFAFAALRHHARKAGRVAIFGFATMLAIQLVQYPFGTWLLLHPTFSLYLQAALFLAWAAWLRQYVVVMFSEVVLAEG